MRAHVWILHFSQCCQNYYDVSKAASLNSSHNSFDATSWCLIIIISFTESVIPFGNNGPARLP